MHKSAEIFCGLLQSRPARGGWIEMALNPLFQHPAWSLAPRGAGGLKFIQFPNHGTSDRSRPARGGWIEIPSCVSIFAASVSLAPRGAGGLKLEFKVRDVKNRSVSPREGRVD